MPGMSLAPPCLPSIARVSAGRGEAMTQSGARTVRGWLALALGFCLAGCAGPRVSPRDDPFFGAPGPGSTSASSGGERVGLDETAVPPPDNGGPTAALASGASLGTPRATDAPAATAAPPASGK